MHGRRAVLDWPPAIFLLLTAYTDDGHTYQPSMRVTLVKVG